MNVISSAKFGCLGTSVAVDREAAIFYHPTVVLAQRRHRYGLVSRGQAFATQTAVHHNRLANDGRHPTLIAMSHLRYHVTKNSTDQYWSVIDIFTGWPVNFHGVILDTLQPDEADRMVDVLNLGDMTKRDLLHRYR